MADAAILTRRSALASVYKTGEFGAVSFSGPGIVLSERTPLSILQIEARPESVDALRSAVAEATGVTPSSTPNQSAGKGRPRIIGTGSNRWLVVEPETRDLAAHLRGMLPEGAAVTDLGHARTSIRLSGRDARTLLAKGTGIDVHPDMFTPETSRMTGLFHASVLIDCRSDAPVYDIYVFRSYAVHLWEMLLDGALEFGCRVG